MNAERFLYRTRQFWQALGASPDPEILERAWAVLAPPQRQLFVRLQPSEQAHSLRLMQALCDQGETNPDLLVAALLHDVGKTRHPLRLWERVAIVLVKALFPNLVRQLGSEPARESALRSWRRAFMIAEQHPLWGAELAAEAGTSPLATALIRRHQEALAGSGVEGYSLEDRLLRKLQIMDDES